VHGSGGRPRGDYRQPEAPCRPGCQRSAEAKGDESGDFLAHARRPAQSLPRLRCGFPHRPLVPAWRCALSPMWDPGLVLSQTFAPGHRQPGTAILAVVPSSRALVSTNDPVRQTTGLVRPREVPRLRRPAAPTTRPRTGRRSPSQCATLVQALLPDSERSMTDSLPREVIVIEHLDSVRYRLPRRKEGRFRFMCAMGKSFAFWTVTTTRSCNVWPRCCAHPPASPSEANEASPRS